MSKKFIYLCCLILVWIISLGWIVPNLISAADTLMVISGVVYVMVLFYISGLTYNKFLKDK